MPFVIQHKQTKELFKAKSGKTSWQKPAHAKNAFANSTTKSYLDKYDLCKYKSLYGEGKDKRWEWDSLKFDEQDVWEIVELKTNTQELFGESLILLEWLYVETLCNYGVPEELADKIEKHLIACGVQINYED